MSQAIENSVLFKDDLIREKLSIEEIFQKYIVDGTAYFFGNILNDIDKEYEVKLNVSKYLDVHLHEVIVVGSAKMGFSLNPKNLFNPFDNKFNSTNRLKDKSDIDIAVISTDFFDRIGKGIFDFTNAFNDKWETNNHYDVEKASLLQVPICYKFFEYYSKGWFRIDYKPTGFEISNQNTFENFKLNFKELTGRKIGLGIYKDWFYFKHYHMNNMKILAYKLKTETL